MKLSTVTAFCLGCVFTLLCAIGIEFARPPVASAQAGVKWEYKQASAQTIADDGKQGWEAYATHYLGDRVGNLVYFLKRHAK